MKSYFEFLWFMIGFFASIFTLLGIGALILFLFVGLGGVIGSISLAIIVIAIACRFWWNLAHD